jgi:hypothetical protein
MLSQETCGYLVVLTYAGSIFEQASDSINLRLSPNKQTIVVGALQLIGSIVASCIVEKTGRKVSLHFDSCELIFEGVIGKTSSSSLAY